MTNVPVPTRIAGLVLMGGEARRMGGGDKALLLLHGRPILGHALDRLRPQAFALALSANGDPARLGAFGLPVLPDAAGSPGGPLSGVVAGLTWAAAQGASHLLTVPGDAPFPPRDLGARLWAAGGGGPACAASPDGPEPLHALWPLDRRAELDRLIAEGVSSPRRALAALGAAHAPYPSRDGFRDADTPDDLAALRGA
ncbi:molybdopterin-guanine dinucleotide biosynthesis protein A [Methylopila jiangsuensis]|nr:NTP transferase domain-containing protein [Methylopila jiangsuensis]MDR6285353.1 molybdopterin-guanine dinucleotide biosynthesis protein A [Methylopila jiangsuensis]